MDTTKQATALAINRIVGTDYNVIFRGLNWTKKTAYFAPINIIENLHSCNFTIRYDMWSKNTLNLQDLT